MKTGIRNKKYFYVWITIILILVIVCVLFQYTSTVQKNSRQQSFSILDESRELLGQMIANEMQNEQGHIEAASSLMENLLTDYDENKDLILQIMNASSINVSYAHWEICLPDERVIQNDGTQINIGDDYSFLDRVQEQFSVSERRVALKDGTTPIIMLSKCIFKDGTCIGILSSVVDINAFAQKILANSNPNNTEVIVFERGTGDILIDTWHQELGNIKTVEKVEPEKGYDWDEVADACNSGRKGNAAFFSKKKGETMFLSYASVPYSDWQVLLFAPGSVSMKTANSNRETAYKSMFIILLAFFLFFAAIETVEKQRQKAKELREIALQDALKEANKANAAKSEFLSRMSHDIRTPLNGIIGCLDIAEANKADAKMLELNRKKARTAADHLLTLINDVLNMSKLEDGSVKLAKEAFDLRLLAEDVLTITHMRAEKAGITLQHEDCSKNMEYPYVYGSPLHIRQIFVNILGNAIKYNKPGGKVSMKIETGEKRGHQISYICTIADTGIGMAPEFLEHLFEPFAQEKTDARSVYQGTGLGMAIVKALVDKMGGTIRVQSEVNVGTEFVVEIPFEIAEEKDVVVERMELDQASIEGVKILIAEDNELNMEIATELLKERGAVITQVTNGKEAVEMFADNPPGTFDVILMDIMMPVLNGLEATKAIRVLERKDAMEIPIIALTANAFFDDIQKSREAGMNAHLAKPFDIEKMIQTIAGFTKK